MHGVFHQMKSYKEFIVGLNESKGKFVSKTISDAGKGKGKVIFDFIDEEDFLTSVSWKDWKSSSLPDTSSDLTKRMVIQSLLQQEKQFNKKVDFNAFGRKTKSFKALVDWLLDNRFGTLKKAGTSFDRDKVDSSTIGSKFTP